MNSLPFIAYLVDCAFIYIDNGGTWRIEHWDLIRRAVDYTADRWRDPDYGIWELSTLEHYVSSKVMAWVALDRGIRIAKRHVTDDAGQACRKTTSRS